MKLHYEYKNHFHLIMVENNFRYVFCGFVMQTNLEYIPDKYKHFSLNDLTWRVWSTMWSFALSGTTKKEDASLCEWCYSYWETIYSKSQEQ